MSNIRSKTIVNPKSIYRLKQSGANAVVTTITPQDTATEGVEYTAVNITSGASKYLDQGYTAAAYQFIAQAGSGYTLTWYDTLPSGATASSGTKRYLGTTPVGGSSSSYYGTYEPGTTFTATQAETTKDIGLYEFLTIPQAVYSQSTSASYTLYTIDRNKKLNITTAGWINNISIASADNIEEDKERTTINTQVSSIIPSTGYDAMEAAPYEVQSSVFQGYENILGEYCTEGSSSGDITIRPYFSTAGWINSGLLSPYCYLNINRATTATSSTSTHTETSLAAGQSFNIDKGWIENTSIRNNDTFETKTGVELAVREGSIEPSSGFTAMSSITYSVPLATIAGYDTSLDIYCELGDQSNHDISMQPYVQTAGWVNTQELNPRLFLKVKRATVATSSSSTHTEVSLSAGQSYNIDKGWISDTSIRNNDSIQSSKSVALSAQTGTVSPDSGYNAMGTLSYSIDSATLDSYRASTSEYFDILESSTGSNVYVEPHIYSPGWISSGYLSDKLYLRIKQSAIEGPTSTSLYTETVLEPQTSVNIGKGWVSSEFSVRNDDMLESVKTVSLTSQTGVINPSSGYDAVEEIHYSTQAATTATESSSSYTETSLPANKSFNITAGWIDNISIRNSAVIPSIQSNKTVTITSASGSITPDSSYDAMAKTTYSVQSGALNGYELFLYNYATEGSSSDYDMKIQPHIGTSGWISTGYLSPYCYLKLKTPTLTTSSTAKTTTLLTITPSANDIYIAPDTDGAGVIKETQCIKINAIPALENGIIQINSASAMSSRLTADNLGKVFLYTGTTTSSYTQYYLYVVGYSGYDYSFLPTLGGPMYPITVNVTGGTYNGTTCTMNTYSSMSYIGFITPTSASASVYLDSYSGVTQCALDYHSIVVQGLTGAATINITCA